MVGALLIWRALAPEKHALLGVMDIIGDDIISR